MRRPPRNLAPIQGDDQPMDGMQMDGQPQQVYDEGMQQMDDGDYQPADGMGQDQDEH